MSEITTLIFIILVAMAVGHMVGYNSGYKVAERKFREYMRYKYGHNSIFP